MGSWIAYQDYVQSGTTTVTLGSFPAGTPASNILTRPLGEAAQSTTSSGGIRVDLGSNRNIQVIAALGHNIAGTYDIICYASGVGSTPGSAVFTVTATGVWSPPNGSFQRHLIFVMPALVICRHIEIKSTGPTSDGLAWKLGRLWAGPRLSFPTGIRYRWETTVEDRAIKRRTKGGQMKVRPFQRGRLLQLQASILRENHAFGESAGTTFDFQQLDYLVGRAEPVIAVPRDTNFHTLHRLAVYGSIRESTPIISLRGNRFGKQYAFEEEF